MPEIDEKEIERRFESISKFELNHEVTARDLERVRESLTRQMSRQQPKGQKVWRIIMKSKITKLAAAAVVFLAVFIVLNQFGGSIDLATISFADITEAMKNVPWMRMESRGFERGITGLGEQWFGFETKILAGKMADGKLIFWNIKEHKKYEYDPENRTVTIDYAYEDDFPLSLSSPVLLLEGMCKMAEQQGAQIITKSSQYKGQIVQVQEISFSSVGQNNENHIGRLYIQPKTKLLLAAQVKGTDSNGKIIMDAEITFSYPQTGPVDIYDLGVPHDAKIISKLPTEDYQAIWDNYRQKRAEATKEYIAIITHARQSLHDAITMVDVDYKSNQNHRLERHFVFNTGQGINKFWPQYKEQLGDSFESLLAWTQAHYNDTGHIAVYLYDGQYNFSTSRDNDGSWSNLKKDYSPGRESMPNTHLEYLVWPFIGKTGRIIEDDYAKENNFICIERLQQGSVHSGSVTLPARFLFYLDPQKDYMCRRKVMEWRPDAEWQQDKNWLEGVKPEKIKDGSIYVQDITDVSQASNGHWYPEVIVVEERRIRKDYKEAPLKVTGTKRVYVQTHPEFPNGIFEPSSIIPAGAKNRKEGDKTAFEQRIAIIDSRPTWPEPKELVERYWQARAKKDYDEMALLWPHSAYWDREFIENEKLVEYVFGEPQKINNKNLIVPYAAKSYYDQHGTYNLTMRLTNEKSAKGRYYIISGN